MFRGLAIFAVVTLHIDEGVKVLPTGWWRFTEFAGFAVPFFLATSFYLAINKLFSSPKPYPLRLRLIRLLIPYTFWSVAYVLYKATKYYITNSSDKLIELFHDPLALICFGGAAFHLYFLPLLAMGSISMKFSEWAISKQISLNRLVLLCFASLLSYEILLRSGCDFKLGESQAFQPLIAAIFPMGTSNPFLRLMLVLLAWFIRCMPYILVAMILNHPATKKFQLKFINRRIDNRRPWLLLLVFAVVNIFGSQLLPLSLYEILRGNLALWTAISFSDFVKANYLIQSIGACSFGIYSIHLFIIEFFQSIAKRTCPEYFDRTSIPLMLTAAIAVIGISWGITSMLMKSKRLSKLLF